MLGEEIGVIGGGSDCVTVDICVQGYEYGEDCIITCKF